MGHAGTGSPFFKVRRMNQLIGLALILGIGALCIAMMWFGRNPNPPPEF